MLHCCETNIMKIAKSLHITDHLVNCLAFNPPKTKTYKTELLTSEDDKDLSRNVQEVSFIHQDSAVVQYPWIKVQCYKVKKPLFKKNLIILHIINKKYLNPNFSKEIDSPTLLISHGNSCDLGTIYPNLIDMSTNLKINIISYDYSGYGESEGKPSEKMIYQDIEHVAEFMNKCLQIDFRNVILFGNSLGSAVSIHIATNIKYKNLKAIILLSPIVSGLKIVNHRINIPNEDLEEVDFFSNISKIKEVSCPIFLIHGQRDELIPFQQVIQMSKSIKKLYNWFPKNGDHNNIMSDYRVKFFSKCKMFFDYLKIFFKSSNLSPCSLEKDKFSNGENTFKFKESFIETSDGSDSYKPGVKLTNNQDNITCCAEPNNLFFNFKNGDEESYCKEFEGIKNRDSCNLFFEESDKRSLCGNLNNIDEIENVFNVFQKSLK